MIEAPSLGRAGIRDLGSVAALWMELHAHHARLDARFRLRAGGEDEAREVLGAVLRGPDTAAWLATGATPRTPEGLCIVRIDRAPPILEETGRAEITDLFVRPVARRRGIGRALVRHALAFAAERGAKRVEARVAHANAEGQAFWRALGFADFVDVLDLRL